MTTLAKSKIESVRWEGRDIFLLSPMRRLLQALDSLHQPTTAEERLGLIVGRPGLGKTLGCRYYAATHPNVVHIQLPPAAALKANGALTSLIESRLGMPAIARGSLLRRMDAVIEELRARPRMLLLDTAHRLKYDHVDTFRYFSDEAHVPIAFVSVPALLGLFQDREEFARRLHVSRALEEPKPWEITALMPRGLPDEITEAVYSITGGSVGRIVVLSRHIRRSSVNPSDWTPDLLQRTANALTLAPAA